MSFALVRTPEGVDLDVTGDWSERARACLLEGRADGLVLNHAHGFSGQDLEFVTGLPVRRLTVLARAVVDMTPVYSLADTLVSLRMTTASTAVVDLRRLPLLRTLSASWIQVRGSMQFAQRLERLFLRSYKERDLMPLTTVPSLEAVVMKDYPGVHSLDGVDALPMLSELGIFLARGLGDISALSRSSLAGLRTLQLEACRRIRDIDPVASCTGLTFLDLSDGAEVPSVGPLAGLAGLDRLYLYGSTKVADGDLGPIARLPRLHDFRMQDRRTYSPSVKEIHEAIERRWAG